MAAHPPLLRRRFSFRAMALATLLAVTTSDAVAEETPHTDARGTEPAGRASGQVSPTVALSTTSGWQLTPDAEKLPYGIMLAPGIALGDQANPLGLLRLELGLGLNLIGDGPGPGVELWPMLVLGPAPNSGLFMRVIGADLLQLLDKRTTVGLSAGIEVHSGKNGLFFEAGMLGRGLGEGKDGSTEGAFIVQGRIGMVRAL